MIRKWDIRDEQAKKHCVDEVLARIDEQGDAPFGIIAAGELIEIVAKHLRPEVHNRALQEAKKTIQSKLADLEVDIDILRALE